MKTEGYYYLHTNNELIYKPNNESIIDIRESDFCVAAWPFIQIRKQGWNILVEALSIGALPARISELADIWACDDTDAIFYAGQIGCILGQDGNMKTATREDFINLQESQCGFGVTYLEAMSDLCKKLGYTGGKLGWHNTFEMLLKKPL